MIELAAFMIVVVLLVAFWPIWSWLLVVIWNLGCWAVALGAFVLMFPLAANASNATEAVLWVIGMLTLCFVAMKLGGAEWD